MAEKTIPLFIGGEDHLTAKTFDVISPRSGKLLHRCASATVEDASLAVSTAAEAFKAWKATKPRERRDILLKAADIIWERREELVQITMFETGATQSWASRNLWQGVEYIRDIASRISSVVGTFPIVEDLDSSAIIKKLPYGPILSIVPWNAPYTLSIRAIASPIAVGNTLIVKATEMAPLTVRSLATAFQEAGLPKGVINVIFHEPAAAAEVTKALVADPRVKKVNFTGSTNVGRIIGKLAGEYLKPVVMELGGKAPAIVWEDADLDLAAKECSVGAFLNSGQICMSTERIIVHKAVKAEFSKKFKAAIDSFVPASGDSPILVNGIAVQKNKALIADATSKGASILHGDINVEEASATRMRPIVLDKVTKEMDIYKTESFGPTVSLYEVETEEEAIELANDTEYGLTSAIFTEDLRRGLRFASELDAGAVHINSKTVHDESALPHGGHKSSGYGRFNSTSGLEEWVWSKNITFKN